MDDAPRQFDDVFAGESASLTGHGVVEQAFVGVAAFAEGSSEVDGDIDALAVEVWARRLGLQRERHAVLTAEAPRS